MGVHKWTTIAIGVNQPTQRADDPRPIYVLGAEWDAQKWIWCMSAPSLHSTSQLLLGKQATWSQVRRALQVLDLDEVKTQCLLITFSGLGCCLPSQEVLDPAAIEIYHQAICLYDRPITPEALEPLLKPLSKRFERVVLLLDTAFCNVEGENGDTRFFREAMASVKQAEYAPLRAADPSLLVGVELSMASLDRKRKSAARRFDQLARKAGVEVLLADECHAWETSDSRRRFDDRKWQGVFSFAAQNAIQFGTAHWPWNNLGVTEHLIPYRFFPQRPVIFKPKRVSNRGRPKSAVKASPKDGKRSTDEP